MCVECVGYLLEELRDPKNVAAFKKDVESSNIFIGSLIFVQVHVNKSSVMRRCSCTYVVSRYFVRVCVKCCRVAFVS